LGTVYGWNTGICALWTVDTFRAEEIR